MTAPRVEGGREERISRARPPWWLLAGVVAVLLLAVGGNLYSGWLGRDATTTTTRPVPTLAALYRSAAEVVQGDVVAIRREGKPKEPTAVARIRVLEAFKGRVAAGQTVTVADRGFTVDWSRGDRVLLFLRPAAGDETEVALLWVQERFHYDGDRLLAPFTEADVRAEAG